MLEKPGVWFGERFVGMPPSSIAASLMLGSGYGRGAFVAAAEHQRGCDRQRSCRKT
ncbi:hypothetical protein C4K18_2805 [Pseudomonas chlororaphis subsp. aurantiaca]|nr:hypothetical protein C4K18_2805 [Pseudomonas chlororaphis subsp. aurantiaca]